jgi:catechol 2,3-dioxygenase
VATPDEGTWDSNDTEFIVFDKNGNRKTGIDPLDLKRVMEYLSPDDDIDQPMPKGTITGHVHLYVNNLQSAMNFYSDVLGFHRKSLVSKFRMGETILPGYDVHIIAFNDWKGSHATPAPQPATGLNYFTIDLKEKEDFDMVLENFQKDQIVYEKINGAIWVKDPSQNRIQLTLK